MVFITFMLHFILTFILFTIIDPNNVIKTKTPSYILQGWKQVHNSKTGEWVVSDLPIEMWQILVIASLFSSIDLLAVMPQVPNDNYGRFHNLCLGQGLCCDVIAVMLIFCTAEVGLEF